MDLHKLLSINVAVLSALGTLLLALGERNAWGPVVVWLCAVVSVPVTDFFGWFRLNRNLAAAIGLGVLLLGFRQLVQLQGEARLLTMADLLIYLQIILLFQKKDQRVYRELGVISLLQVVVAAGFSQGVGFGLLLVVYMFVGLSAMTLMFLHREWGRYEPSQRTGDVEQAAGLLGIRQFSKLFHGRMFGQPASRPSRSADPEAISASSAVGTPRTGAETSVAFRSAKARGFRGAKGDNTTVIDSPVPGRWPLAVGSPEFVSAPAGNIRSGIVAELFGRLGLLGFGTLTLAVVIFFTVPRLGQPAWRGATVAAKQVVGFSDRVALGSLGEILESREEVMRLELIDPASGRRYQVEGEVYLRGAVLTHYDKNEWSRPGEAAFTTIPLAGSSQGDTPIFVERKLGQSPSYSLASQKDPRQDKLTTSRTVGNALRGVPSDPRTGEFFTLPERHGGRSLQRTTSEIGSSYFDAAVRVPFLCSVPSSRAAMSRKNGRRSDPVVLERITVEPLDRDELFCVWPFTKPKDEERIYFNARTDRLLRSPRLHGQRFRFDLNTSAFSGGVQVPLVPCQDEVDPDDLLQLPALPRLTSLAAQWMAESRLPPEDRLRQAQFLEQQLATSTRFQYSLQGQDRDLSIDAIEDFVSQNPRGHCEYFATALALMLRSQGIPARVVIGYKCDEWNTVGRFFQVRQLHAHAWVEAHLEPRHIPASLLKQDGAWRWAHGGWLRLDGTPAASTGLVGASATPWGRVRSRFDWVQSLWNDYVVEMDRQRQREAVYQPVIGGLQRAAKALRDPQWWRETLDRLASAAGLDRLTTLGGWLSAGVALLVGLLAVALTGWGVWRLAQGVWLRLAAGATARNSRNRIRIDFYRKLENLLARRRIVRRAGQTPREFARAAACAIVAPAQGDVAGLPERVVDAYYGVRYGGRALAPPEVEAVRLALRRLEDAMR